MTDSKLQRLARNCALALGLCVGLATAARAAPVVFNFQIGFSSGALAGQTSAGSFSVDGADCPAALCSGAFAPSDAGHTLLSFEVTVGGTTFTAADDSGFPFFPGVTLSNNVLTGMDFLADLGLPSLSISALSSGPGTPLVVTGAYTAANGSTSFIGSLQQVPEPATPLLVAAALLAGLAARRRSLPKATAAAAAAATLVWTSLAGAVVPTPTVTGPLASPDTPGAATHNYTFWATDIILKNYGYVEEEFFFEGLANRYDARNPVGAVGNNGTTPTPTANIVTPDIPYKSRMRVIRPTDAAKFNGTVVVEWTNVTNGYDTPVWWLKPKAFYLREGYAYVEVSAQNAGLNNTPNGLRNWSPTRYSTLNVNAGGTQPTDVLSYDIFSQAAAAVRNVPIVMGGLPVQVVIGTGESQSAGRLGIYVNAVHVRDPIYSGIIMSEGGEVIRTDLTMPVMKVLSETEFAGQTNEIGTLQPDTDKFRMWPVAGGSHSDQYSLLSRAALLQRDLGLLAQDTCATPARSRVEMRYIYAAAVDAMNKWVRLGTLPPNADRFVLTNAPNVGVARDANGNAVSAIRTAEIDVPVAKEAADTCGLGGTHVPFTTAVLNTLYASHDDYVNKVVAAAQDSVAKGFVLAADAREQIARAKGSIWGLGLECGPLCADVRQFPLNPSSILLRNQTAFLLIKGAENSLVPVLESTTLAIAQGYTLGTGTPAGQAKFKLAMGYLDTYVATVKQVLARGNTRPETANLLVNQATTLKNLLAAQVN